MRGILDNKRGAMEMSIGTIVIIVLAMSMLILGLVLVRNIFGGASDITDMTIDQVKNQISQMFGEQKKLVVYPDSKNIEVKSGENGAFAVGIQNRLEGTESDTAAFRYEVSVAETGNCPDSVSKERLGGLIVTGREINPTAVAPGGDPIARKVTLSVPEGFPLCTFSYQIDSYYDGDNAYASDFMDVTITA